MAMEFDSIGTASRRLRRLRRPECGNKAGSSGANIDEMGLDIQPGYACWAILSVSIAQEDWCIITAA